MPVLTRVLLVALVLTTVGCMRSIPLPDLGGIYDETAMYHGPDRNPVIVIPGILGSKLVDPQSDTLVWGAFGGGAANPSSAKGARLIALPMQTGVPLRELKDGVQPDGSLDRINISILGLPVQLDAYVQILGTLGVGGYRDLQLGEAGAVDYGEGHYTCFQFAYDWRRDNVENAHLLHDYILEQRAYVQGELAKNHGGNPDDYDVNFDIVAHSMGGLLTRYMLRYGKADLPEGDAPAEVTWAGAEHVDRVVLVGTPSGGAVSAVTELVDGVKFTPIHPRYSAAVLGTMPAIYQLMPRERHRRVRFVNPKFEDGEMAEMLPDAVRLYDSDEWQKLGWGLADPDQDRVLRKLLPEVGDAGERRAIALEHQAKCMDRAERFHAAMDSRAELPEGLDLYLFAGDAQDTPDIAEVDARRGNRIRITQESPGDGTVTRGSALMDERLAGEWRPTLQTPIDWTDVNFLFSDHLGLTADPEFSDNMLYLLLEDPR